MSTITVTLDPFSELPSASGKTLDACAAALHLPSREIDDDSGYGCVVEADRAYKTRLAQALQGLVEKLRGGA